LNIKIIKAKALENIRENSKKYLLKDDKYFPQNTTEEIGKKLSRGMVDR
jgi:hypothetical protein